MMRTNISSFCYGALCLMLLMLTLPPSARGDSINTCSGLAANYADLRRAGMAEYSAGDFERAETLLRNALNAAQLSGDKNAVATIQNELGDVYQTEERLIEAERAYVKAVSIFSQIPGETYNTALALRNVGSAYSLDRRDSDALKVLQEAVDLIKKDKLHDQALFAQILNSMAIVHFRQGKTSRADKLLIQAIQARASETDDFNLGDANILNNLGMVYRKQRKYAKAEESYKRSLEITGQGLGPFLTDLALTHSNLAGLYTEMRRYREAEDHYRQSL